MICTGLIRRCLSNVAQREWLTDAASEACIYIGNEEDYFLRQQR